MIRESSVTSRDERSIARPSNRVPRSEPVWLRSPQQHCATRATNSVGEKGLGHVVVGFQLVFRARDRLLDACGQHDHGILLDRWPAAHPGRESWQHDGQDDHRVQRADCFADKITGWGQSCSSLNVAVALRYRKTTSRTVARRRRQHPSAPLFTRSQIGLCVCV